MKKESMRKYSLLGLVLIGASALTAAVLPTNDIKKDANNGRLVQSNGGDLTCEDQSGGVGPCTITATNAGAGGGQGSRTSTALQTSRITTDGESQKVRTISSVSVGGGDIVTDNQVHTSLDRDNGI